MKEFLLHPGFKNQRRSVIQNRTIQLFIILFASFLMNVCTSGVDDANFNKYINQDTTIQGKAGCENCFILLQPHAG